MVLYNFAPDVGTLFEYEGQSYRVSGWLNEKLPPKNRDWIDDILYDAQQSVGPDNKKLKFCKRQDAQYVCGAGVCGVIARTTDIVVTGRVPWSELIIDELRQQALAFAGQVVF